MSGPYTCPACNAADVVVFDRVRRRANERMGGQTGHVVRIVPTIHCAHTHMILEVKIERGGYSTWYACKTEKLP